MHTRFLTILAVSAFVLTLLFAVAAGAQDESTGATQVQVRESQQVTVQAVSCPGAQNETTVKNPQRDFEGRFDIVGGAVRITYEVKPTSDPDTELFFELRDEDGDVVRRIRVDGPTEGEQSIRVNTRPGEHEFEVEADEGLDYSVRLEDCTNVEARNDDDENDPPADPPADPADPADPVVPAQTDPPTSTTDPVTADPTTTDPATTDDPLAEDGTDTANREGSFRCDSFLRVVRDEDGALRRQYRDGDRDDELIVQRFEQCLEADVLVNTIPDGNLPFTGGMSLFSLGAAALLIAGGLLSRWVIRRR